MTSSDFKTGNPIVITQGTSARTSEVPVRFSLSSPLHSLGPAGPRGAHWESKEQGQKKPIVVTRGEPAERLQQEETGWDGTDPGGHGADHSQLLESGANVLGLRYGAAEAQLQVNTGLKNFPAKTWQVCTSGKKSLWVTSEKVSGGMITHKIDGIV